MFETNDDHGQLKMTGYKNKLSKAKKEELEKGWSTLFYKHVFTEIDEENFSKMYSDKPSRPNFPVNILIGLEILKHIFNLTDKELIEKFHFDIRFLNALGIEEIGEKTLSQRTLYEFRNRLAKHLKEHPNLITELFSDLIDNFIEKAGISTNVQRMDSSMIESNIKSLSRIQLLYKVAVNFIESLPKSKQKNIHKNIRRLLLKEENFKNYVNAHDKEEVLENLCGKLYDIKLRFKNDSEVNETKEYKQLTRIIEDQTIVSSEEIIPRDDSDIDADSLQNPADEDATYRKKGNKSSQGYAVNISETADPDNPVQMITDVKVKPNIHSDPDFLVDFLKQNVTENNLDRLVVDSSYHSTKTRNYTANKDIDLLPTGLTGRNPEHSTAGFELKTNEGIISCPMGNQPTRSKYLDSSNSYAGWFKKEDCKNCDYKNKCPITEQKKSMTVRFTKSRHKNDQLREQLENPETKELMRLRPAIEGTFSALKRAYGLGKLKVRGLKRTTLSVLWKCIGYNFNQLVKVVKERLTDSENNKIFAAT